MIRHIKGLFELILRLMPPFDASEPSLGVARAANICVFRGTAPLGAYQRSTGDEEIDPPIPITDNRRDPYNSPNGYLQPDPVPIVRLNWPLASQIFFAPASFYSAVRQHESDDQPLRNMELRANMARIYNALINVYYAQDHLEDAIRFHSAR